MLKPVRALARVVSVAALALAASCAGTAAAPPKSPADQARIEGPASHDAEVVGRWLLAELVSPGSDTRRAAQARTRLDSLEGKGLFASLARAMDDEAHGRPKIAALDLIDLLKATRDSGDPLAPLAAWYASNRLLHLRDAAPGLWTQARPLVESLLTTPGSIGWRARGELVEWWAREAYRVARKNVLEEQAAAHGCRKEVRLAGPFGRGVPSDRGTSFAAEKPGAWPARFAPEPLRPQVAPQIIETDRDGCEVRAKSVADAGIYYAETFFDLEREDDVIVAVQGSRAVLVDDSKVLDRSPQIWGVWPTFGAMVHLGAGRHRVVARLESPATSIRLQHRDGTPWVLGGASSPGAGYETAPPQVLADPNVLNRFVHAGSVVPCEDHLALWLAGYLAHVEGQDDLADVIVEPLVKDIKAAAPLALSQQALYVAGDPIFPDSDARDLTRELHAAVIEKDPGFWRAKHWLVTDQAQKKGLSAVVPELRALALQFPDVPQISRQLASIYEQLGWKAEHAALVTDLAQRFPEDADALGDYVQLLEAIGRLDEADKVVETIRKLEPDSEVDLDRALRRHEYGKAVTELERLGRLRPEREDIADKIADVMRRAGLTRESFAQLERAIAKEPTSGTARLALADAKLATGEHAALRTAIASALQAGGKTSELLTALELVEGRTELEPYRLDARKVIAAYEKTGVQMDAPAVRVLDYGVTWVHPDGSSRMLEHEIVRVQSQEAITKLAEQRIPSGLLLRARVLKKDGREFEPEFVADKPSLTMPHLEVGDCIETESITTTPADGQNGASFLGPHWFFREADIAYWRSELVVISPKDRPLVVESWGQAPAPEVTENGYLTVRKWLVDKSPAAVMEPGTVPIRELLPSVRVSWGVNLEKRLRSLVDSLSSPVVFDPRLQRIAERIVQGIPAAQREERARRLYRWVLANVEPGEEHDGRRIVVGKSGELGFCFIYLARLLGIPTTVGIVRSRIAQEPVGPASEAELYDAFVIRVQTEHGDTWLTVRDKYTPFGYVPADVRGQSGFLLVEGTPKIQTTTTGAFDGVIYDSDVTLRPAGGANLKLARSFVGKYAIALRSSLETVPPAQLRDAVESNILGSDLPGASLVDVKIDNERDLDKPATLQMTIEMPDFARRKDGGLVISPPFNPTISNIATLPERKTTMLIAEASHIEIRLRITLPEGATVATPVAPAEFRDGDRVVQVRDRVEGRVLILERVFDIPASRISPEAYGATRAFARAVDDAVHRDIRIALPK